MLERIVKLTSSAFLPQCAIHDSILVAYDITNKFCCTEGKKGHVDIKLDMEKVYDRLELIFLFHYLHIIGFHMT